MSRNSSVSDPVMNELIQFPPVVTELRNHETHEHV